MELVAAVVLLGLLGVLATWVGHDSRPSLRSPELDLLWHVSRRDDPALDEHLAADMRAARWR